MATNWKRIKKLRAMMDANPPQPRKDPLFDKYYPPAEWVAKLRAQGWSDKQIQIRADYLNYDVKEPMSNKPDPIKILTAFFVNNYSTKPWEWSPQSGARDVARELAEKLDVEFGADGDTIEMALRETFKGKSS